MNILVIGGTRFVGRHFVEAALANGHTITLFNRGKSNDDLFPNVEHLRGDRDGGLDVLDGRQWDAVVDTCGYVPRIVRASAEKLKDAVGRYLFISTISVYDEPIVAGADEDAPLQKLDDPTVEEVTNETYGGLKVLCEQAVADVYGERGLIVRPGMIVGPYDPTDRYTYWDLRLAQGGEVLVPGDSERSVQMIDARDLAAWMVCLLEANASGVINATGPEKPLRWIEWMEAMRAASGSDATFTWVTDDFLKANETNGGELPFWVPEEYKDIFSISVARAVNSGLTYRPAIETARDTLAWKESAALSELKAGVKLEREAALLKAWREKQGLSAED